MTRFLIIFLSIIIVGCASTPKQTKADNPVVNTQINTSEYFQFFKINDIQNEKDMNTFSGQGKAFFYARTGMDVSFYSWWITADFYGDKLMKNVVLHLPVKLHFAGLHQETLAIELYTGNKPISFPEVMQRWVSDFYPVVVNGYAIPVVYQSFSNKDLTIKLGIPSSLFFKNIEHSTGICDMKSPNFVLKNGTCRFNEGNHIYVENANLMMGFKDKTIYGLVRYEPDVTFPQFKDYDFGEVLIWNDQFIIYGENFDAITPMK